MRGQTGCNHECATSCAPTEWMEGRGGGGACQPAGRLVQRPPPPSFGETQIRNYYPGGRGGSTSRFVSNFALTSARPHAATDYHRQVYSAPPLVPAESMLPCVRPLISTNPSYNG